MEKLNNYLFQQLSNFKIKIYKTIVKKLIKYIVILVLIFGNASCNNAKSKEEENIIQPSQFEKKDTKNYEKTNKKTLDFNEFIPKGFELFEKIYGDLNKDGVDDCVLIIKGADAKNIVKNEDNEMVDKNRRGIIILFNHNDTYKLVSQNLNCFSSENEDGGVYYVPELSVDINKGNLTVDFANGRYGFSNYTFRFKNSDFELIGYDSSENNGPIINIETSINYLTKKKILKENTNENAEESGEEIFKETTTRINNTRLLKLSEIKDFDQLEVSK